MFGLIPFRSNKNLSRGNTFEDLVSDFFNDDFFAPFGASSSGFNADIKETDNEYLVIAELPGVKKEDISLEYNNNQLVISAKRDEFINEEKDRRGVGYISAHSYFDKLLNDPQLTSVLHLP